MEVTAGLREWVRSGPVRDGDTQWAAPGTDSEPGPSDLSLEQGSFANLDKRAEGRREKITFI